MTLTSCRRGLMFMVLALTGVMVNGFAVMAQEEHSRQTAPDLHHVTHVVQDMQVVVHHRDDRMPPHTYTRFAPTQVSMDEETLVIVGTITESPANATADITIRMKTSGSRTAPHPDEESKPWWEDDDLRNAMEQEGD